MLAVLAAAGVALAPRRSGPDVQTIQAEPDLDDDDWTMPPPRQEFAI